MYGVTENRFSFRLKSDTSNTISRATLKAMATHMKVSETQVIHLALKALAKEILCCYEPDEGDLTHKQMEAIKKIVPVGMLKDPIASLFQA